MIRSLLLAFACLLPGPVADDPPDFAALGKQFVEKRLHAASAADVPADELFAKHCVHAPLGLFEVAFPAWSLADKAQAENLRTLTLTLLGIEGRWIDWLGKGEAAATSARADVDLLAAWVKGWKLAALGKADAAKDKNLLVLLAAGEAEQAAAKRLAESLCRVETLGVAPKDGTPLPILFAPTRRDFVELLGYAGLADPAQQNVNWTMNATQWTSFWIGWKLVLALEYTPWVYDPQFKTGLSMNKFEPTGMLEHTVQQTMLALLWKCYGDSDALHLNQAQALNMAIEVCGECNALEGDGGRGSTGAKTEPYEKFVPGGNPNGGVLPPIPAAPLDGLKKIPWREGLGKDHFAAALRKGQKNALKEMVKLKPATTDPSLLKDKQAHFLLVSQEQAKKHIVTAPFFGAHAASKAYPPLEVIADYKEFFRSYKCAFSWWVQAMGDKAGAEASAAKYKQLLRALAAREGTKTLEEVVKEIYGVPLSGKNGEEDSLEWRFLEWLGKGK